MRRALRNRDDPRRSSEGDLHEVSLQVDFDFGCARVHGFARVRIEDHVFPQLGGGRGSRAIFLRAENGLVQGRRP